MFNKKLIIDSLKNLSKPSRMTNKNTFDLKESGSKREGFVSAQEGVDTPIYKAVKTGASPIEGKGLFAEQSIRKGDVIGVSHIRKKFMKNGEEYKAPFPSTVLGYYNHSEEPNVYEVDKGGYILMVAGRDIQRGHEITSDYTKHNIGDLEVPEDFKKGGSIKRPSLPNRKSPRSYSRSFEATNKFFAKNPLFAKSKSRKNKIFDPRAQYFDNGGISKLEGDLISKVIMNRNRGVDFVDRAYALGDNPGTPMFNLPDDEQFGQNMSHKMAWGEDDNGQAWMYPTIMNPNDEAIQVPNQYADYISSEGYKNATGMNQYAEGGASGCPKGFYWNGKKCVKIPKGAKVITNPKEYSERKAAYQDSSDLYKSSLGIKRFFPKLPEITEEKYDELTKKYDDLTIWNIDKVGYKEDKKSKIKKPIESYIYSYKNKDQFENPTFIKNNKDLYTDYGDDYEKYQIKLKNGDIKIPGIVYKGKPDFNTAYAIISPNGTSRDYHLNYETNKFDLVGINSPTIEPVHRSYYGSDKLKKDGSIDFSSTGWYGKGKKPNKNELKQWLNHTLEFEYFDTYKKPVQPVVFQEVDKSVLPTTRTVYIDCPPGSVANGQTTKVTTDDPDSPGNYLTTITTGCDPIKEKEVIIPIKEPVINTGVTKTEEVPMGIQEYPEELEGPNWEWDRKYHSFTTPRLNKHFPLGPLFNGKKKHTFSTPSLHRRKDYKEGGGLHKFLEGGGNPTCEYPYVWNPETNRCEKKTGCPDDFHFDVKSGRCISNYQKEGKATIKVRPKGTNTYVTATPDQLTAPYDDFWPEDLNLEEIADPVYFPEAQQELRVTHPNYKGKHGYNTLTEIKKYPDLNYKVVIDPSKPEGFNKNENIYYVKSENTHQARKYKEWEQLKALEKQNIQKLTDAGFYIEREPDGTESEILGDPITMRPKASSEYYTYKDDYVDADGNTHIGGRDYKEGWDYQKITDLERPPQEYYNDPEYLGHVPQNVSFEDFYKGRPGTSMEEYTSRCKNCSYVHGINYKVDDDYLYRNINLSNVDESNEDDYEIEKTLEHEYADPSIESMYPKLEFEEGVDPPDYYTTPTEIEIPTVRVEKGNTKSIKFNLPEYHKNNYFTGKTDAPPFHGKKPHHINYKSRRLDFGRRDMTRLIPKLVQKATGYDEKYMQGYYDDEGNYFPGEIEKAEEEGRQINFKGAMSLRDMSNQKKYNKGWKNTEEQNKLIRQQNEDLLKEYGLNREEYVKLYGDFKNGGLIKAADGYTTGTGDKPSITATPFDFRSSYGQIGNYNKNPNYSLTYTNPKLFKKMDAASNALSFTLGRPYNTDAASLTNPTLDFSDNTQWDYQYNVPGWAGNQEYQNFWQNATAGGNNQATFDSYQATQNLASIKPKYKKGLPLVADIGYDLVGNAFGSSSSGPFTGTLSTHAGYAPESGLYGNIDGSMLGVFGRRKNRAKIKPRTYYDKGLTRQGDYAFIPKLNIFNAQIKQRADYNAVQEAELIKLMKEDAINGTRTARPYAYKMDSQDPFDLSFLSPELTFQAKPFKNIPGVLSATGGLRLNFQGGKEREGVPITPNFYGNVRYTMPLGEVKRKISARMPERRNYDDEENDYEKTETEVETEVETDREPAFDEDVQLNFDGQGVGKADCRDGYERPCEKCKCQKIKIPTSYTDKRGKRLFGNEPITFKQGGISLELSKDEIQKYVDGGYVVEDSSSNPIIFNQDNETEYELGGIIEDEETKKYLESIGYTFETI